MIPLGLYKCSIFTQTNSELILFLKEALRTGSGVCPSIRIMYKLVILEHQGTKELLEKLINTRILISFTKFPIWKTLGVAQKSRF